MKYDNSTDSFNNEFLEPILGTDYLYGVPYVLDKEKYNKTLSVSHQGKSRFKDTDIVTFSASQCKNDDGGISHCCFFAYPQNSPEDSDDFYDCFIFYAFDFATEKEMIDAFNCFVSTILICVKTISVDDVEKLENERIEAAKKELSNLSILQEVLAKNK